MMFGMKKLINKMALASALLFASHAFAQDNKAAKFIPDSASNPVSMGESNGIKAAAQLGTLNGKKAFTVVFQNTSASMAYITIAWKMTVKGVGSPLYNGRTHALKLKPGQTINLERADPKVTSAYIIKGGTTMDDYKITFKVMPVTTATN